MSMLRKKQARCRPLENDEAVLYDASSSPWHLIAYTHDEIWPKPGSQNFCECLWSHIRPGPSMFLQTDQTTGPESIGWTQEADKYVSILWFHSRLHKDSRGSWTACNYHEALSVLLGYTVSQHSFFTRVKIMRNTLPECWIDACLLESTSPEVSGVFQALNLRWQSFMEKFDIWQERKGIEDGGKAGELLQPVKQWDRVLEMRGDLDQFLKVSEEQPDHIDRWLKWWISR